MQHVERFMYRFGLLLGRFFRVLFLGLFMFLGVSSIDAESGLKMDGLV